MSQLVDPNSDRLKRAIMQCLDHEIRARYKTLQSAADAADTNIWQLSRVRTGVTREISIGWLLRMADRLGARIRITVSLVREPPNDQAA